MKWQVGFRLQRESQGPGPRFGCVLECSCAALRPDPSRAASPLSRVQPQTLLFPNPWVSERRQASVSRQLLESLPMALMALGEIAARFSAAVWTAAFRPASQVLPPPRLLACHTLFSKPW